MSALTKERTIVWRDQSFVTEPRQFATVQVYRDFWWIVNEKGQIGIFGTSSPQCNISREIAERFGAVQGAAGVEQIPLAFVEIDLNDYRD